MINEFNIWAVQMFVEGQWRTAHISSYEEDSQFMYNELIALRKMEQWDDPTRLVKFAVDDLEYVATIGTDFEVVATVATA